MPPSLTSSIWLCSSSSSFISGPASASSRSRSRSLFLRPCLRPCSQKCDKHEAWHGLSASESHHHRQCSQVIDTSACLAWGSGRPFSDCEMAHILLSDPALTQHPAAFLRAASSGRGPVRGLSANAPSDTLNHFHTFTSPDRQTVRRLLQQRPDHHKASPCLVTLSHSSYHMKDLPASRHATSLPTTPCSCRLVPLLAPRPLHPDW